MQITLHCETNDTKIEINQTEKTIAVTLHCFWQYIYPPDFPGSSAFSMSEDSAKSFMFDRIIELAVLREIQINRQIDVVTFRSKLQMGKKAIDKFRGVINKFHKSGAVDGESAGIDKDNGYPYKRWRLIDDAKAKSVTAKNHWPLMRPAGKIAIQSRSAKG